MVQNGALANSVWSPVNGIWEISGSRDTQYLSVFSLNAGKWGKNADQNNSEYGHFLHSVGFVEKIILFILIKIDNGNTALKF